MNIHCVLERTVLLEKSAFSNTKGAEPNNNDVCRTVGLSPPPTRQSALDKSEFPGPYPEKTGVGLIIDQLGLMSTIRQPSEDVV
jgi:hypothetical protein